MLFKFFIYYLQEMVITYIFFPLPPWQHVQDMAHRNVHHKIPMNEFLLKSINLIQHCHNVRLRALSKSALAWCARLLSHELRFPKTCTWYMTKDVNDKVALRSNVSDENECPV